MKPISAGTRACATGGLVNVCGTSRAGTTMLHLMLANGPDAFACGEVYAWFRPWRLNHFCTRCACGDPTCEVWRRLTGATEDAFHTRVLEELGRDFVVDCSKRISWLVDANRWARAAGIAVHNILIWKEPQDHAYSYWKRGRVGSWKVAFLDYHRELLASGLPLRTQSYTDLVRSPSTELRGLCEAVGIPYYPGREEFWRGEHHYLFGSRGVRAQLRSADASIALFRDFPAEFRRQVLESGQLDDPALQAMIDRLRALGRKDG